MLSLVILTYSQIYFLIQRNTLAFTRNTDIRSNLTLQKRHSEKLDWIAFKLDKCILQFRQIYFQVQRNTFAFTRNADRRSNPTFQTRQTEKLD